MTPRPSCQTCAWHLIVAHLNAGVSLVLTVSIALGIVSLIPPSHGISVPAITSSETTRALNQLNQPT